MLVVKLVVRVISIIVCNYLGIGLILLLDWNWGNVCKLFWYLFRVIVKLYNCNIFREINFFDFLFVKDFKNKLWVNKFCGCI